MSARAPAVTELLDEAEEVVLRVSAPWTGVLWLTALPYRMLQVHLVDRLLDLGSEAAQYGHHLEGLAAATSGALVLWLLGRMVFVKACRESLRQRNRPGLDALRLGWSAAATYLYVSLVLEVLFVASAWTFVAAPVWVLLSGLAAAQSGTEPRASLVAPWRELERRLRSPTVLVGAGALFAFAFVIALANLYVLFTAGVWLAQAWPGLELGPWDAVLSYQNRSFWLVLVAGAALVVEPFWLGTLTVYVQRMASRETGEDLRMEWLRVRAGAGIALLAAGLWMAPCPASAERTVADYADALDAIERTLAASDVVEAARQAEALRAQEIAFAAGDHFVPDPVLLTAVAQARTFEAPRLARRVAAVAAALRRTSSPASTPADRALLESLRRSGELRAGGNVASPEFRPLPQRIADAIAEMSQWLADQVTRIWDWLKKLWPTATRDRTAASPGALGFTLGIVALALVLMLLLAVRWRRRIAPAPLVSNAPLGSRADEDPLSRESAEWQSYARELAAAGRTREAIRAWYHAVLVALFRRGALEPRKGRTNWEHAARLGPDAPYRPAFLDITRRFDREWYGRDESSREALEDCADLARSILESVRAGQHA